MRIDIWSDVVCPWCFIGRRRLQQALARFDGGDDVEIVHRAFELDPSAPSEGRVDLVVHLARKYGATREQALGMLERVRSIGEEVDIDFRFDIAQRANTLDAHRLVKLADRDGLGDAMLERLMLAYFTEGEAVGDRSTLARLAGEVGLDPAEASEALASNSFEAEVRADQREARELGVTGVPFFLIDGKVAVPGAQDVDTLVRILERVRARALS
jgi:predicted DsbA family dithiol-disulfide isomerase